MFPGLIMGILLPQENMLNSINKASGNIFIKMGNLVL
jgi:hypothetical protein